MIPLWAGGESPEETSCLLFGERSWFGEGFSLPELPAPWELPGLGAQEVSLPYTSQHPEIRASRGGQGAGCPLLSPPACSVARVSSQRCWSLGFPPQICSQGSVVVPGRRQGSGGHWWLLVAGGCHRPHTAPG